MDWTWGLIFVALLAYAAWETWVEARYRPNDKGDVASDEVWEDDVQDIIDDAAEFMTTQELRVLIAGLQDVMRKKLKPGNPSDDAYS